MNRRLTACIENHGRWLYHRRSVTGVALLPLLILAIWFPGLPGSTLSAPDLDRLGDIALLVSLAGLALRWFTVGSVPADTSVRSTREMRAAQLNTHGIYSVVRHPLYLANGLVLSGFVAATGSLWFLALFVLVYVLYIERIAAAEECFLESLHGPAWRDWITRTPAFIPNLSLWRPSNLPFSLRTVFRREYNGVFGVGLGYFVLEATLNVLKDHQTLHTWLTHDTTWSALLLVGVLVLLVLRTLKRHTRQLHVKGR